MERLFEVLAREFVRRGHAVTVVTETPGEPDPELRPDLKIVRVLAT